MIDTQLKDKVVLVTGARISALRQAMEGHILSQAELTSGYTGR